MRFFEPTILDRYLLREILRLFGAILLVVLLLIISNKLARFLRNAASGEWPVEVILPMLGLVAVNTLGLLTPLAVFLAVLMAVGRLRRDNEMAVLNACGVGLAQLYRPVGLLAVAMGGVVAVMSFYVIPLSRQAALIMETRAAQASEISGIAVGRFRQSAGGGRVVYIERVDEDSGQIGNVFVHSAESGRHSLITAATARRYSEADGGVSFILEDGYRYSGRPGVTDFRITRFATHHISIGRPPGAPTRVDYETRPSMDLLNAADPHARAELHTRIAVAVGAVLFTLLGLPFGAAGGGGRGRGGRYERVLAGALIYLIFFKSLEVGQVLLQRESVPAWLGMWWLHAALLGLLVWAIYAQARVTRRGGLLAWRGRAVAAERARRA